MIRNAAAQLCRAIAWAALACVLVPMFVAIAAIVSAGLILGLVVAGLPGLASALLAGKRPAWPLAGLLPGRSDPGDD